MPDLKLCPLIICGGNSRIGSYCIGKKCAWWCEFAGCCSVPLIAEILADSTICQNVFDCRAGEEEKHEAD